MSNGKSIIVDTSRCTGCRGCQVACKQWNGLPASPTTQTGTYQNPPDFNGCTYKVVRSPTGAARTASPTGTSPATCAATAWSRPVWPVPAWKAA